MQPLACADLDADSGLTSCSCREETALRHHGLDHAHWKAATTDVNATLSFEPRPESAVMMATDMPAAISAYSMAVVPLSSRMKRARSTFMIREPHRPLGTLQVNHRHASISLRSLLKLCAIRPFQLHD